jgi:Asp-tRNA(Asn)/Glu-tRNA(Gln) amidotransferase A subunit family amidase
MDVLPGLFDTISHHGPLATCADDARLFLAATQGPDDADILSIPGPLDLSQPLEPDAAGLRLALSIDLGCWAVDPEIADAVRTAADRLADAGAIVEPVDLQLSEHDAEAWDVLWGVFMSAYYGHLVAEFGDRMDPAVLSLIDAGNRVSASDYKRLELVRTDLWRRLRAVLADHDALLCPTMAQPPWPAAKPDRWPARPTDDEGYHSPAMTEVFNLVSPCPALSVPCGYHRDPEHAGLPIGLQVVGRRWREDTVLRVAKAVEAQDS